MALLKRICVWESYISEAEALSWSQPYWQSHTWKKDAKEGKKKDGKAMSESLRRGELEARGKLEQSKTLDGDGDAIVTVQRHMWHVSRLGHMWLVSTWNVAGSTEELNF